MGTTFGTKPVNGGHARRRPESATWIAVESRLATDRRDAYDAVSRVRHSFERVDDDFVPPEHSRKVIT
jgi:hypothetical protein